jgi:transcriptional regulator of acetoin/glycerol metabolism
VLVRLAERHRPRLVLTATDEVTGHGAAVAALCPVRLTVPALRSRRDRIPAVAAAMLGAATEGRARFTSQALRTLAAHDWPGNLRELRTVIDDVAGRRSVGDVTEADLPAGYRGGGRPPLDGALWQAERDAVVHALCSCAGNKVHAARMLGISRNTLYRRLRVLRIDPDALIVSRR